MGTFIGVDLGWYGKPSGLSAATLIGSELHLRETTRLEDTREILDWIAAQAREDDALVAVDAPLVIPNEKGIRQAERDLNRDFRRFHAGCHPANLGRPFAANVIAFSRLLGRAGFRHGAEMKPRQAGRFQIEVHPHAATVSLFGLDRIVKYKRGARDVRARELRRLRTLMQTCLPHLEPALSPMLPPIPRSGNTKPAEDMIDAVLCAFIAAHWWHWTTGRNTVYGSQGEGYIIVPHAPVGLQPFSRPASQRASD